MDKHRPASLGRLDYHREQAAQLRNLVSLQPEAGPPPVRSSPQSGPSESSCPAACKAAPAGVPGQGWALSLGAGPSFRRSFRDAGEVVRGHRAPLGSMAFTLRKRLREVQWLEFSGSDMYLCFLLGLAECL